jgi:hypothetical protein
VQEHDEQPYLRRLFEAVAGVMDLDRGEHVLELHFTDGRLRDWWTHARKRPPAELRAFEDRARQALYASRRPRQDGSSA